MFSPLVIATLVVQIILALVLIVTVLFQNSNQEGLGAISGSSDTFFGKNKGRTLDAKLKKVTGWVAFLFLVSSVLLGLFVQNGTKQDVVVTPNYSVQQSGDTQTDIPNENEGNLPDEDEGNISDENEGDVPNGDEENLPNANEGE